MNYTVVIPQKPKSSSLSLALMDIDKVFESVKVESFKILVVGDDSKPLKGFMPEVRFVEHNKIKEEIGDEEVVILIDLDRHNFKNNLLSAIKNNPSQLKSNVFFIRSFNENGNGTLKTFFNKIKRILKTKRKNIKGVCVCVIDSVYISNLNYFDLNRIPFAISNLEFTVEDCKINQPSMKDHLQYFFYDTEDRFKKIWTRTINNIKSAVNGFYNKINKEKNG